MRLHFAESIGSVVSTTRWRVSRPAVVMEEDCLGRLIAYAKCQARGGAFKFLKKKNFSAQAAFCLYDRRQGSESGPLLKGWFVRIRELSGVPTAKRLVPTPFF